MRNTNRMGLLSLPLTVWMVWFLLIPLILVTVYSLQSKGPYGGVIYTWSLEQFKRALDPLYANVFLQSLRLSLITAVSTLVIGYPMAWMMARSRSGVKHLLMVAVMMPFMSNFVIRAYAVKFLIGVEGPINHFLLGHGLINSPLFQGDPWSTIWYGMITNYLPFMVIPLYVAIEQFDYRLVEAARDLGAGPWQVFRKVIFPLTLPAILAGSTLVFVPAMGEFIIPDLMGGSRTMFIGNLIADQFLKTRDWPFGSALSVFLLAVMGAVLYLQALVSRRAK